MEQFMKLNSPLKEICASFLYMVFLKGYAGGAAAS